MGRGAVHPNPALDKLSIGNLYLKILEIAKLLLWMGHPYEKKSKNLVLPMVLIEVPWFYPSQNTFVGLKTTHGLED